MYPQLIKSDARRWRQAALVTGLSLFFLPLSFESRAQSTASPLESLAGSWSGSGTITLASGERERIRCRATYSLGDGGRTAEQDLRCASDSYNFDVDSRFSFNAEAGTVSGTWQENNYKNHGLLSGTARAGLIQATVEGRNLRTTVSVNTNENEQSVSIRPQGTDVSEVTVTMRRGG